MKNEYIINCIKQIDHANDPSKVEFLKGGIGSNQVTIAVSAEKGGEIGSEFHFYGEEVRK